MPTVQRCIVVASLISLLGACSQPSDEDDAAAAERRAGLPATLAWTAYNLGTTGYNQSVGIGKALKDRYGVSLRVIPGKNDISRLLPLRRGRVHFAANGVATYFAQEGMYQFAARRWGPQPVQLVMSSRGDSNQGLAVAADLGIHTAAGLRGKRVAWVRSAPSINVSTEALLACGGLSWDDVVKVEFPGYGAMWTGVVNNLVDAAYATTVSGPTRKLEASPRGIRWLTQPHADRNCWRQLLSIGPYFTPNMATRGAAISVEHPHEGATYPYPLLTAMADQDPALVTAMARAIHATYDDYKQADPGSIGWALERQNLQWVVPYHSGAVDFFREVGLWTDADTVHNDALLDRQRVLAAAWRRATADGKNDTTEAFATRWQAVRRDALMHAGMDPVW